MKGPVYLHVGLKKTGTSYLQSILRASTEELSRQGLSLLPRHEPAGHRLAKAVLGRPAAGDPIDALPRQLARAKGDRCLLSQETLGRANRRQIGRLTPALSGHDVHVIVTVRDIARTIPSAWQQYVQARNPCHYGEFLDAVRSGGSNELGVNFWRDHGVVDVLQRWGAMTKPSQVHVVIVPPPDAPRDLLLQRFCSVIGVDPSTMVRHSARPNESLGLAQVEMMRRLNEVPGEYAPRVYGTVYKRGFARAVLAGQPGRRPLMPVTSRAWCDAYTERVVESLVTGGYDVVGDAADLHPPASAFTDEPQQVSEAEVSAAAIDALRVLLDDRAAQVTRARARRRR